MLSASLFILSTIGLTVSIFPHIVIIFGKETSFFSKVEQFVEKNRKILSISNIVILCMSFTLSQYESRIKELEHDLLLEKTRKYNSHIKSLAISYSVGFEIPTKIYDEETLFGTGVVYAKIGNNVTLTSPTTHWVEWWRW